MTTAARTPSFIAQTPNVYHPRPQGVSSSAADGYFRHPQAIGPRTISHPQGMYPPTPYPNTQHMTTPDTLRYARHTPSAPYPPMNQPDARWRETTYGANFPTKQGSYGLLRNGTYPVQAQTAASVASGMPLMRPQMPFVSMNQAASTQTSAKDVRGQRPFPPNVSAPRDPGYASHIVGMLPSRPSTTPSGAPLYSQPPVARSRSEWMLVSELFDKLCAPTGTQSVDPSAKPTMSAAGKSGDAGLAQPRADARNKSPKKQEASPALTDAERSHRYPESFSGSADIGFRYFKSVTDEFFGEQGRFCIEFPREDGSSETDFDALDVSKTILPRFLEQVFSVDTDAKIPALRDIKLLNSTPTEYTAPVWRSYVSVNGAKALGKVQDPHSQHGAEFQRPATVHEAQASAQLQATKGGSSTNMGKATDVRYTSTLSLPTPTENDPPSRVTSMQGVWVSLCKFVCDSSELHFIYDNGIRVVCRGQMTCSTERLLQGELLAPAKIDEFVFRISNWTEYAPSRQSYQNRANATPPITPPLSVKDELGGTTMEVSLHPASGLPLRAMQFMAVCTAMGRMRDPIAYNRRLGCSDPNQMMSNFAGFLRQTGQVTTWVVPVTAGPATSSHGIKKEGKPSAKVVPLQGKWMSASSADDLERQQKEVIDQIETSNTAGKQVLEPKDQTTDASQRGRKRTRSGQSDASIQRSKKAKTPKLKRATAAEPSSDPVSAPAPSASDTTFAPDQIPNAFPYVSTSLDTDLDLMSMLNEQNLSGSGLHDFNAYTPLEEDNSLFDVLNL
ncbi:hypothetical protein BZG36_03214 [Bifiguratus adelaidae]|uniref:Uncharacterized protein n=1 Tax=Bifiguratus adelaidae TaxID=1938954 RepID=A0A261Y193_9FUNG|nr:hypothetical protein BZG36_03214 [Bifiguratus adelaidae]